MNSFTIVCKNDQKITEQLFCIVITKQNQTTTKRIHELSVSMPEQIITACILLSTISKNGLRMESFKYILADNNICNTNQPINLPWKVHFELVNRSASTVFSIC